MRTALLTLCAVALMPAWLNSQERALSLAETLQVVKAGNAELLKRQATTLQQLDALIQEADQVRILSKRN